jgi:lysozyme family protein
LFDFGVNAGTGRAAKKLQAMIGTVVDGGIGPNTLAKLNDYLDVNDIEAVIHSYQQARQEYYESLSTFATFGRGWTRRNEETTKSAIEMIRGKG